MFSNYHSYSPENFKPQLYMARNLFIYFIMLYLKGLTSKLTESIGKPVQRYLKSHASTVI